MDKVFTTIFLAIFASLPTLVLAHHSESYHYDTAAEIQMEAILTDFQLVNPHGYVFFDGLSEEGELVPWRCEMSSNLRRRATQETLLPGGRVLVTGNPARREENVCKLELIEHEDGRTIASNGVAVEGASNYKPSATLLSLEAGERQDLQILAVGGSVASMRIPVEVPTEGFFGHWNATAGGFLGLAGVGRDNSRLPITDSDIALPTTFIQPEYTESGQEMLESFDERFDYPSLQCKSSVIDGIFHHGNINEFVQESSTSIRWVYGYMDLLRTVHLDQTAHPENMEPSLLGHSFGYWEGDSLIVETAGFRRQWLYQTQGQNRNNDGHVVSSENLTLRERITLDEKNDNLVVEYSAVDPDYWQEPLSGTYHLSRSTTPYQEYNCIELGGYNNLRDDGTTFFD